MIHKEIHIKRLSGNEIDKVLELVMKVFLEFEAPDYSQEGIRTFQDYINDDRAIKELDIYGALIDNQVIGVIATRNINHISLFFVDREYHQRGIGKQLFHFLLTNTSSENITVNSSPYAVEVYHHLGFTDTNKEQLQNGIRYTPMIYYK
jgi:GNAT superfamily N-acetyltransferase